MAFVTIRIKNVDGFTRAELTQDRVTVGRSSSAVLPVKNNTLSREHCAFVREGERWLIEDLGSQNGTWVNKTKVLAKTPLNERDIVKAGQARLTFHAGALPGDGEGDGEGDAAAIELALEDGEAGPTAPVRARIENEPLEATPCVGCGAWMSIAHRLAGDDMPCPRCGHSNIVPQVSA